MCFTDSIIQTKTVYHGSGGPKAGCNASSSGSKWISNVSFNTINNSAIISNSMFIDYSCFLNTDVVVGNSYPLSITTNGGGIGSAWIDFDTSGTFTAAEELFNQLPTNGNLSTPVVIPVSQLIFDIPLRLRVIHKSSSGTNDACFSTYFNDGEDYSVTIRHAPIAPTASYTYTTTVTCSTAVMFANATFNGENYYWDFGDGDTSSLVSPIHSYAVSGTYSVSLITSNAYGTDTSTQMVVIQNPLVPLTACEPAANPSSCDRLYFTGMQVQGPGISPVFFIITPYNGPTKLDYTCTKKVQLLAGSPYTMFFGGYYLGTTNCGGYACAWIDWNNDGTLNNTDEKL